MRVIEVLDRVRPTFLSRLAFVIIGLALVAFSFAAVGWTPWAYAGLILFGSYLGVSVIRLATPTACATEVDDDGLLTRTPVLGRPMLYVKWVDIEELTFCDVDGWRGLAAHRRVAWRAGRSDVRSSQRRHRPFTAGGVNSDGIAYNGALPDGYLGFEKMTATLKGRVDAAKRREMLEAVARSLG